MANENKTFLDLAGLTAYDTAIKGWANGANQIAFKKVIQDGDNYKLYKNPNAVGTDTPDATINVNGAGAAAKTVYITETAGGAGDLYSKRYGIYQGSTGSAADPVVAEKLADIDIPKDMVVESGSVVQVTFNTTDNKLYAPIGTGGADIDVTEEIKGAGGTATSADAGAYILLVIANATSSHLWIKATDLVDIYTSGSQLSDDVQIVISNNQISATLNGSGISASKINYAIPDVYTEDDTVTADNFAAKIESGIYTKSGDVYTQVESGALFDENETYYTKTDAHNETVQNALARIDAAIGTGGSVDTKISNAIGNLNTTNDVSIASYTAGTSGSADVITLTGSVKEEDGIVESGTADTITLSTITASEISNLFS